MRRIEVVLAILFLVGCSSLGGSGGYDKSWKQNPGGVSSHKWPSFSCRKEVKETITVSGTFDGGGCEYVWKGKYADKCDAPEEYSENVPKMFVLKDGATLKNVGVRCSPDGIGLGSKVTLSNVKVHVEEDGANSSNGDGDITIRNSEFYFASDKAGQHNPGTGNVRYENVKFFHVAAAIKYDGKKSLTVEKSTFFNVDTAVRCKESEAKVVVKNSRFENVDCALEQGGGCKIQDGGGNTFVNVKNQRCQKN